MKKKEDFIDCFLEPYFKEVVLKIIIDIIGIGLVTAFMAAFNFPVRYFIYVFLGYGALVYIPSYRIIINALIDKHKKDYITETFCLKDYDEELSLSGEHFGYSYIHRFYPKDMHVTRYKIKVIDKDGKKKKLRSVMSYRRVHKFWLFHEQSINLQITYLKRSKIIIHVELAEKIDKKTNKKDVKEIEKALHIINMSL